MYIVRDEEADQKIQVPRRDSRYGYDGALLPRGWKQYDTREDAWYFGVWVNSEENSIFCYAEGDRAFTQCENKEEFKAELARMAEFYGDPPPAFSVIDLEAGTYQEVYDVRPTE